MLDSVRDHYAVPLMRAFRQAPWRTQTQAVAAWSVILLAVLVLGGLYLQVASRAAVAGRDLQALEAEKVELVQQNAELRAELARLRSVVRLADRARALGFVPAGPANIEYLAVPDYPHTVQTSPPPRAVIPPAPPTTLAQITGWLVQTLQNISVLTGNSTAGGG